MQPNGSVRSRRARPGSPHATRAQQAALRAAPATRCARQSDAGAPCWDGSGRRLRDGGCELGEIGFALSPADEVAEEGRVRPFAALMCGDSGELEQDAHVLLAQLELFGRSSARA